MSEQGNWAHAFPNLRNNRDDDDIFQSFIKQEDQEPYFACPSYANELEQYVDYNQLSQRVQENLDVKEEMQKFIKDTILIAKRFKDNLANMHIEIDIQTKLNYIMEQYMRGNHDLGFFMPFLEENQNTFIKIKPDRKQNNNETAKRSDKMLIQLKKKVKSEISEDQQIKMEPIFASFQEEESESQVGLRDSIQPQKIGLESSDISTRKRGPYKHYSLQQKENALRKVQIIKHLIQAQIGEGKSIAQVCIEEDIPKKNLKRWIAIGAERKKGGGRKRMDAEMEEQLEKWYIDESLRIGRPVSRQSIRNQALMLSNHRGKFKASKGWTDKFVKKYGLRKKAIKALQEKGLYQQYLQRKMRQILKMQKKEEQKSSNLNRLLPELFDEKQECDSDNSSNEFEQIYESVDQEIEIGKQGQLVEKMKIEHIATQLKTRSQTKLLHRPTV